MQYINEEIPERQISPEEYLAEQKSSIRKRAYWATGIGALIVGAHLGWLVLFSFAGLNPDFSVLFRSVIFILGLFALGGGIWGFRHAKNLKLEDLIPSPEAIEFARQTEVSTPYFTYILLGLVIAVTLCQLEAGLDKSRDLAGLIKTDFWSRGEYWRLLTYGTLHGGVLHIFFNGQALLGFGGLIEHLSNRAHLLIVFVLAIAGGGLCSLLLMPDSLPTIGASGGIMGLLGYLAIYGYRRQRQLPPNFLKSMMINVGFIAAFGIIAYQIIDNFAHLGGFAAGAVYGLLQIPGDLQKSPRSVGSVIELAGYGALLIFVFACIYTALLLLKVVQ